jgi:hypothetical protein
LILVTNALDKVESQALSMEVEHANTLKKMRDNWFDFNKTLDGTDENVIALRKSFALAADKTEWLQRVFINIKNEKFGKELADQAKAYTDKNKELIDKQIEVNAEIETAKAKFGDLKKKLKEEVTPELIDFKNKNVDIFKVLKDDLTPQVEATKDEIVDTTEKTPPLGFEITDLSQEFLTMGEMTQKAVDALGAMGIISEELTGILSGLASGVGAVGSGLDAFQKAKEAGGLIGTLGQVSAGFSMVTGAISVLSGVVKLFAGKSGELKSLENYLGNMPGLTKDWSKELETLAKEIGGTDSSFRAVNASMAEIIRTSQISVDNFSQYVTKVREIVSTYERGTASISETETNLGNAFSALIEQAKTLGLEGSTEIHGLIKLSEEFGLNVKEITEYTETATLDAYGEWKRVLETGFDTSIEKFDLMYEKEQLLAGVTEDIKIRIEGTAGAMENLGKIQQLNSEEWEEFNRIAEVTIEDLLGQGYSMQEASQIMSPLLQQLYNEQQKFGSSVNDTTQELIDMGIENGSVSADVRTEQQIQIDLQREQNDLMRHFIKAMGVDLPPALATAAGAYQSSIGGMINQTYYLDGAVSNVIDSVQDLGDEIGETSDKFTDAMIGHSMIPQMATLGEITGQVVEITGGLGSIITDVDRNYKTRLDNMRAGQESLYDSILAGSSGMLGMGGDLSKEEKEKLAASYGGGEHFTGEVGTFGGGGSYTPKTKHKQSSWQGKQVSNYFDMTVTIINEAGDTPKDLAWKFKQAVQFNHHDIADSIEKIANRKGA